MNRGLNIGGIVCLVAVAIVVAHWMQVGKIISAIVEAFEGLASSSPAALLGMLLGFTAVMTFFFFRRPGKGG